jgi:hypothetical protein
MELSSSKIIKDNILSNYIEYQYLFVESQSKFLSSLYSSYQSVENGNLVIYYEKETHQDILREKDYDLNFNISYEKFWENHLKIKPKCRSLIKIAENTFLPKETVRRKILQLIKKKVLGKKDKCIGWLPSEEYKQNYNLFVNEEIESIARQINFICKKLNYFISREEITKELKENFSFYRFHYLGAQIKYLNLWTQQFKDSELALIFLQVVNLFASKAKNKNITHKNLFDNPNLFKEFITASVSATSIAEVTKIPRATCVRKLEHLVKLKMVSQDKISKRYYIIPDATADNLISQEITDKVVSIFSNLYFICVRAIKAKA